MVPCGPIFPEEAQSALAQFKALQLVDVILPQQPGHTPTIGEIARPWVFDFVAAIFGAYDATSGRRLIREFFLLISKKNSKSTIAAAIMLTALIRNWRKSGEFLILAPTLEVAKNSFEPARDMIRADPELTDMMHIQEHHRTITHRVTGATLKVVSADNEVVGGKKAIGVLLDELWIFGRQSNAENILREATGGLASRPEGFVISLSTHADAAPAGVFRQKLHYARDVRDGKVVDKRFCPVLYEFPKSMLVDGAPPRELWKLTNPNLGASVDEEYLDDEFRKAEHAGKQSLTGFYAKHTNVEIGVAYRNDRWAGSEFWAAAVEAGLSLEEILARSEVITVGIDYGGLDDLMGLAIIGRCATTRRWLCWFHAWAHSIVLVKRKSEAPLLKDLQQAGDLTIVDEIGTDAEELAQIVANIHTLSLLDRIGVDRFMIGGVLDALAIAKIPGDKVVAIPQGWQLTGAIKTTERKLAEGAMVHGGQKMMDWCVGNAKVEPRGNAVMITKQASGTAKIDPLIALFCAAQLMALNPPPAKKKFQIFTLGGSG